MPKTAPKTKKFSKKPTRKILGISKLIRTPTWSKGVSRGVACGIFAVITGLIVVFALAGTLTAADEDHQFQSINDYRVNVAKVAKLTRSKCLTDAAREWSTHMAGFGVLHHSNGVGAGGAVVHPGDPGLAALVNSKCPAQWARLAENVGFGANSTEIFNAFINSAAHRANIVYPTYNVVGVGTYLDDSGRLWVTHLFAQCNGCSTAWTDAPSPPAGTTVATSTAGVGVAVKRGSNGYWMTTAGGKVTGYNGAGHFGDLTGKALNKPVVGMAATASGNGYWLVGSDGGIFAYGDAQFKGSTGGTPLNKPVVGMAATPSGQGYWLVASDGGIFAYGDAPFKGSTGGTPLNKPIVGMSATPSGQGYWLVASDGGIFAYGDAPFRGSAGGTALNKPIIGMASTASGQGYWMIASDGGIFAYGDALFYGSAGGLALAKPITGLIIAPDGAGYQIIQSDGTALAYGSSKVLGQTVLYSDINTPPSMPQSLILTNRTASSISLRWSASSDDRGVSSYKLFRNGSFITTVTTTTTNDINLDKGTTYNYKVKAVDSYGLESPFSTILYAATCKNSACAN